MIEKTIGRYRYEINEETNQIECWDLENPNLDANNAPFLRQPTQPGGDAWKDTAEAQAWIEQLIDDLINPKPVEEPQE